MYTLMKWVSEPNKLATPTAMGFFLAHLGLQSAEGIGLVVYQIEILCVAEANLMRDKNKSLD